MVEIFHFLTCKIGRYRKIGIPNQFPCHSQNQLINFIQKYNGQRDIYISISEFDELGIYPLWFFIDLDSHVSSQDQVNEDASKILNFADENDLTYFCNESGSKGVHILFELNQTYSYNNKAFKLFGYYLIKKLNLKSFDTSVCEIKRICRCPDTFNLKSGNLCYRIIEREGQSLNLYDFISLKSSLSQSSNIKAQYINNHEDRKGILKFPFCVDFAPCIYNKINSPNVDHQIRWRFVKLLQYKGLTFDEIFNKCKNAGWSDFNPGYTKYQIQYIMNNHYTLSCNKKICTKKCQFRKNAFR